MTIRRLRSIAALLVFMLWSWAALAAATTTAVTGSVEVTPAKGAASKLAVGQRIESGATIKTGENSSTTLRFDDGQAISLVANTTFVVNDYKFNAHKPAEGNFAATLLRGAMRAVTGVIGESNKQNVTITTATSTMGIRGTDFNLSLDNRLYIQVIEGAVSATNDAGEAVFDAAGQPLGLVVSRTSRPEPIQPGDLPVHVQGNFRQLAAVPLTGRERRNSSDPSCSDRR